MRIIFRDPPDLQVGGNHRLCSRIERHTFRVIIERLTNEDTYTTSRKNDEQTPWMQGIRATSFVIETNAQQLKCMQYRDKWSGDVLLVPRGTARTY